MKNLKEEALAMHKDYQGKIEVRVKVPVRDNDDLTLAYSPGVAEPCMEIHRNPDTLDTYTNHANFVCVVSNGTAVLGLGAIGAAAAMPVMEGKSLLFKTFGDVDAFPICVDTKDTAKIVELVELLAPTFGGVNLEDIKAPECFIIEDSLKKNGVFKGPIFHDDQHGTAVVTLAGLMNALKLVGKKLDDITVVTSGAGAAGIAIIKLLMALGLKNVIMCDSRGPIWQGRAEGMNPYKEDIAARTNPNRIKGGLADAIKGADVFIGVSAPNTLTEEMIRSMAKDPIVFAQANPIPEIWPIQRAKDAGAKVVATGRSDCPNQINNVLAFPGIFRGALDVCATDINDAMKIAAAKAIAALVKP
ncbi:NADP-dependent malic enzyme, partial [uncultured Desulfovibrio sp.]